MRASVVVITRNAGQQLSRCLDAVLRQSVSDLEIIVVDDYSTDGTLEFMRAVDDLRVIYKRNTQHEGIPRSRNRGLEVATGDIIFFTDADCVPVRTWVEEGLRVFAQSGCVGVEGRTLPPSHVLSLAHRSVINEQGGQWQTCNIAYRREVLREVGGFDERYTGAYEDRDLALRIRHHGEIAFCPDMLVFHGIMQWTWRSIMANAMRSRDRVRLIVEHDDREGRWGIVVEPRSLVVLLCPVVLPFFYPVRSVADLFAIPMLWVRALVLRLVIWRTAWGAGRLLL